MDIILFSNCIRNLDKSLANTSSQIFELEFAWSLTNYTNVSIISTNANNQERKGNISLFPIKKSHKMKYVMKALILENRLVYKRSKTMIFYGYDLFILNQLNWVCKELGINLISYTFDSHRAATDHRKGLRKVLIDFYFKLGIKKLNDIDGIILFNIDAYKELQLKIPYLISKVGINREEISTYLYKRKTNGNFNIVYAGSLERYNGVLEMIDAINMLPQMDVSLDIYGSGRLENDVIRKVGDNPKIRYKGLVPRKDLDNIIRNADLLINMRDTDHIVAKFSFPSKLVHYLASGVPVISTRVLKNKEFSKVAFVIDGLNPAKISEIISYIIENPKEQQIRSYLAKAYVSENFNWDIIIKEVYGFLESLDKDKL